MGYFESGLQVLYAKAIELKVWQYVNSHFILEIRKDRLHASINLAAYANVCKQ